jgi:hypothetical protein
MTNTKLFQPKGDLPMWRLVYDACKDKPAGTLIPHADLSDMLGYDITAPGASRTPITVAAKKMLREYDRTLRAERGQGYRVARAEEHLGLAKSSHRSARRKLNRAVDLTSHVDRSQLTERGIKAIDELGHVMRLQAAMLSRHDQRITTVEKTVDRVDDRVLALEQAIRKLGGTIPSLTVVEGETA